MRAVVEVEKQSPLEEAGAEVKRLDAELQSINAQLAQLGLTRLDVLARRNHALARFGQLKKESQP